MLNNSLNKLFLNQKLWLGISFFILFLYLLPLLLSNLHVPTYDNLDSNVIWYKILAESGKILAQNNVIIPNMMNGIPRLSYSSEFDLLLWLYYFFSPHTAYVINEICIHLIAFIGSYLFLSKYIINKTSEYRYVLIYIGVIYFSTLPFWSGAGITIASLPLTTYIFLEIKNHRIKLWHWLYFIFLVTYSSFIFMYIFYIGYLILFFIIETIRTKKLNKPFLNAILFFLFLFILKDYRLFLSTFFDGNFVSHRVEFDVFFQKDFENLYRSYILNAFLIGNYPHLHTLQRIYLLPIALVALLLLWKTDHFTKKDSIVIWAIIIIGFTIPFITDINLYDTLLTNNLSLPVIAIIAILTYIKTKEYKSLPLLIFALILLVTMAGMFHFKQLAWITEYLPILKAFNVSRLYFIVPIIILIILVVSFQVLYKKLYYTSFFIFLFLLAQIDLAFDQSFYQTYPKPGYLTFKEYYDTALFNKIKKDIEFEKHRSQRFISYGMEPAVALYNDLYTIDGYSTNYPLSYKKAFRKTQAKQLLDVNLSILDANRKLYDKWGSKLYLLAINSEPGSYRYVTDNNSTPPTVNFLADYKALCDLNTSYIISSYPLKNIKTDEIKFFNYYEGVFWRIWLYRLQCTIK